MIPKIIHQIWISEQKSNSHKPPVPASMPESWKIKNPDWEYRFWTGADLTKFIKSTYPELWPLYEATLKPVMRCDIARYLLLHHFGGIYADLDTTCKASLAPFENETRVILSQEPVEHWPDHSVARGMPYIIGSATMASPKGHPFWLHVIKTMLISQHAKHALDSTGPLMLTGAVMSYKAPSELALHSCHLFNVKTKESTISSALEFGPLAPLQISTHHWDGTWFKNRSFDPLGKLRTWLYRTAYQLTRGEYLTHADVRALVDETILNSPLQAYNPAILPNISILIPLRDVAPYLPVCFALLRALDYPKDKLKITFVEGESRDETVEMLQAFIESNQSHYRSIELHHFSTGVKIPRRARWRPEFQKKRRSAIARVRNHLIAKGLDETDNFALWIDADVCNYPANILHTLLQAEAKIVTPECTKVPGGPSYDLNAFLDIGSPKTSGYYRYALGGLFQPPASYHWRKHMHDLRYLTRVPLTSVGGTMLLVHSSVHLSGITFPEIPYCDLLETEAFAKWAVDMGVTPIGLPQVEIQHVDE